MKDVRCPISRMAGGSRRDTVALREADKTLTYHQLEQDIQAYAQELRRRGVHRCRRVAVAAKPATGFVVAYFALLRLGCVSCLVSTRKPVRAAVEDYARLKCRYILVPSDHRGRYHGITAIKWPSRMSEAQAEARVAKYAADAPANVMFTSGSSGNPKAVVHSVGNHHFSAMGSNVNIRLKPGDGWLLSLPVYHVAGLSIIWRCVEAGATVVIPGPGERLVQAVRCAHVSHISCVPLQLTELMDDANVMLRLSRLKAILLGGSAIPSGLVRKACRAGLPVYVSYGLTEMSSQVATTRKMRSAGDLQCARILPYRQVRVGSDAEIRVKGETLCLGFWKSGRLQPATGADGWYRTGDRGRLTRGGCLQVLGRKDNMIISGGENIYPEEIERILLDFDEIIAAVVVPVPSDRYGQRPVAVVAFQDGRGLSARELGRRLQRRLEKFKVPDTFYRWPLTKPGGEMKADRKMLARRIRPELLIA